MAITSEVRRAEEATAHATFVERFLELERKSGLFALRVRDLAVWDYLRYPVFHALLNEVVRSNEIVLRRARVGSYAREVAHFAPVLLRYLWQRIRPMKYDLLVVNYDRRQKIGGKNRNIHFYPLVSAVNDTYRILLLDPSSYDDAV